MKLVEVEGHLYPVTVENMKTLKVFLILDTWRRETKGKKMFLLFETERKEIEQIRQAVK